MTTKSPSVGATTILGTLVPFAKAHVGIDEGALGLVLLCLGPGSITTLPMAGALAARFGCRQVVIGSAVPLCLTPPLLATAATPVALAVGLFVFGAALGAIDVTMNIQAIIVERRSGRSMMSSFHGLFSVGSIAGPSCMVSQGAKRNLGTEPLSRTEPAAPNNRRRHAAEAGDFRLKPGLHRTRNRKFESVSLQRRVCKLSVPRAMRLRWRNQIHCTRLGEVRIQFPPAVSLRTLGSSTPATPTIPCRPQLKSRASKSIICKHGPGRAAPAQGASARAAPSARRRRYSTRFPIRWHRPREFDGGLDALLVDLAVANSNNTNLAAAKQFRKEGLKWRITGGPHLNGASDRNRRQSCHPTQGIRTTGPAREGQAFRGNFDRPPAPSTAGAIFPRQRDVEFESGFLQRRVMRTF
jgi:hypothetical protein